MLKFFLPFHPYKKFPSTPPTNNCCLLFSMKDGNYTEAFIHWTHAIKLEPNDSKFYFERSKCFLQQEQVSFGPSCTLAVPSFLMIFDNLKIEASFFRGWERGSRPAQNWHGQGEYPPVR